jgi:hypothetical protein
VARRRLSSDVATIRLRFALALFWGGLLAFAAIPSLARNANLFLDSPLSALPLVLTFAVFVALLAWFVSRFVVDEVLIDGDRLVLRRRRSRWEVPLADIELLRERRLWQGRPLGLAERLGGIGERRPGLGPRYVEVHGRVRGYGLTLRYAPDPGLSFDELVNLVLARRRGER